MKKALEFSMVMLLILLAGVFLVTGCSNPSDGRAGYDGQDGTGAPGADGITWSGGALSATQLEALFAESNKVTVIPLTGSITLEGKVPQGKTLVINASAIAGNDVLVDPTDNFEVEGTLEIKKDGGLYAAGYGTSGLLKLKGGTLTGSGLVYLPIILDERADDFDALDYASSTLEGKVAYSVVNYSAGATPNYTIPGLVDESDIRYIFSNGIADELAVADISTDIQSITIPEGKTLILWGTTGIAPTGAAKFEPEGAVIVKGTLATNGSGINIHPLGSIAIEKDGTLDLANAGDKITTGRGTVTNAGTISTTTTTGNDLQTLLLLDGIGDTIGTIESGGAVTLTLTAPLYTAGAAVTLKQNLKITAGTVTAPTVSSSTGPLFTVTGTPKITVAGTTPTPAFSIPVAALGTKELGSGIAIETLDEDPDGNTLYGTVTTDVALSSALQKVLNVVDGIVAATGAVALDGNLEIPEIVTLNASASSGTFGPGAAATHTETVKGTATFPTTASFLNGTAIKVDPDGTATFGGAFVVTTGNVTVDGTASFPALGTVLAADKIITINGRATFGGAVTPLVTIASSGSATFTTGAVIVDLTVNSGGYAGVSTGDVTITKLTNNGGIVDVRTGNLILGAATTTISSGIVYVGGALTLGGPTTSGADLYVTGTLTLGTSNTLSATGILSLNRATGTDASGAANITASNLKLGARPNLSEYGVSGEAGLAVSLSGAISGANLQTALAALKADLDALVGTSLVTYSTAPSINLPTGSGVSVGSASATPVTTGTTLTTLVTATTTAASLITPSYPKYSTPGFATAVADGKIKWLFDSGVLKVVDEGWVTPVDLFAIFTISGVPLKSTQSGIDVTLTTPDFNIGIGTGR